MCLQFLSISRRIAISKKLLWSVQLLTIGLCIGAYHRFIWFWLVGLLSAPVSFFRQIHSFPVTRAARRCAVLQQEQSNYNAIVHNQVMMLARLGVTPPHAIMYLRNIYYMQF